MVRCWAWLCLCLLPGWVTAQDEPLRLAWKNAPDSELVSLSKTQVLSREPLPKDLQAPLGSVWKLFVYAWLVDTGAQEPAYACQGKSKEEVYCCAVGASIARDQALVRSCGLYFEPQRLQLSAADWRHYWRARNAPDWLQDLNQLQPQTRVPVAELLQVLALLPARDTARRVLLDVVLNACLLYTSPSPRD